MLPLLLSENILFVVVGGGGEKKTRQDWDGRMGIVQRRSQDRETAALRYLFKKRGMGWRSSFAKLPRALIARCQKKNNFGLTEGLKEKRAEEEEWFMRAWWYPWREEGPNPKSAFLILLQLRNKMRVFLFGRAQCVGENRNPLYYVRSGASAKKD